MELVFGIFASLLVACTFLPLIPNQHWMFRVWDFGRVQLSFLIIAAGVLGFLIDFKPWMWFAFPALIFALVYNGYLLLPYTKLFAKPFAPLSADQHAITLLAVNVFQENGRHDLLLELIEKTQPDLVLTMESDAAWQQGMEPLLADYPHRLLVPQDDTYGMHFFSKFPFDSSEVNYLISNDVPSVEVKIRDDFGRSLTFYGMHPPPPSPTEEETSEERDGELMVLAKKLMKRDGAVVVAGDFNNVAWARSSKLFKRISGLIDPRLGRGFVSTFHAKYRLMRFPIDLFFHSDEVDMHELKRLKSINSDHFPLYAKFSHRAASVGKSEESEEASQEDHAEMEELIKNGKDEANSSD